MSRYYDPVTHRFLNADGYFQSGNSILDSNMNAYCRNNPIMYSDPNGEWIIKDAIKWIQKNIVNPMVKAIKNSLSKHKATYTTDLGV